MKVATGDIINWLNSDDVLEPGALSAIANTFSQYPQASIVHGNIRYFGLYNYEEKQVDVKKYPERYFAHICMPQPATFFSKILINKVGYLDESLHFSMDFDFYTRAAISYPIIQIPNVLARFRLHEQSKSVSTFNERFITDNKKIISRTLLSLNLNKEMHFLKSIDEFIDSESPYRNQVNIPIKNAKKIPAWFLFHKLLTLHNTNQVKYFFYLYGKLFLYNPIFFLLRFRLHIYATSLLFPKMLVRNGKNLLYKFS